MGRCSLFGATIMLTLHQSPFDLFERLEQQMASAERVPNAEVVEADESYTVRLELPGVERDSIEVKATDRTLEVSAERRRALDRDQLKANYRDGIMEISAGKTVRHTSVTVT